jgi:hypothetical protein
MDGGRRGIPVPRRAVQPGPVRDRVVAAPRSRRPAARAGGPVAVVVRGRVVRRRGARGSRPAGECPRASRGRVPAVRPAPGRRAARRAGCRHCQRCGGSPGPVSPAHPLRGGSMGGRRSSRGRAGDGGSGLHRAARRIPRPPDSGVCRPGLCVSLRGHLAARRPAMVRPEPVRKPAARARAPRPASGGRPQPQRSRAAACTPSTAAVKPLRSGSTTSTMDGSSSCPSRLTHTLGMPSWCAGIMSWK